MSFVTTLPAPMTQPSPIVTPGQTNTLAPNQRLGVAQEPLHPVAAEDAPALVGLHGVQRGDDSYIGPKIAVVANLHVGVVLDGEVKVDEAVAPDLGVTAVVEADRPQQDGALPDFPQQRGQDAFPGLPVLLVKGVVLLAEPMAPPLLLRQLRGSGLEKLAGENPFLFCHG